MGQPTRIGESSERRGGESHQAADTDDGVELIDSEPFHQWFAILEDRFDKEKSDLTAEAYRRSLSSEMNTQLFVIAAQRIFKHNTFFPSPQEFIDEANKVRRAKRNREAVDRLQRRHQRVKEKMEAQGRQLLQRSESGVEGLKEYLRTEAAVPIDERPQITGGE